MTEYSENGLNPSILGTQEYWEDHYSSELRNFVDHGSEGEIWFGDETSKKIVGWLCANRYVGKDDTVIDIGTGNGMLLVNLYKEGFTRLLGVDYSDKAIELAKSVAKKHNCRIQFTIESILNESILSLGSFKVILDKGTYDAICLDPSDVIAKREKYIRNVHRLLVEGGFLVLTSCNWTESELRQQFESRFQYVTTLGAPKFTFGGKVGNSVSSLIFKKI